MPESSKSHPRLFETWLKTNVLLPRWISISVSAICLFLFMEISLALLVNCSLFHPFRWISNAFDFLTNGYAIFTAFAYSLVILLQLAVGYGVFRCSNIKSIDLRKDWLDIFLYLSVNFLADRRLSSFVLMHITEIDDDFSLLLTYVTTFTSLYLSVEFFLQRENVLKFPKFLQPTLLELWQNIESLNWSNVRKVFRLWFVAMVSYFLLGHAVFKFISQNYSDIFSFSRTTEINSDIVYENKKTFYRLIGLVYLLYSSMLFTSFVCIRRKVTNLLINTFLCQPKSFAMPPLDSFPIVTGGDDEPNLTDAMKSEIYHGYLKYLAFWDLSRFPKLSKMQLGQVFSVSRPGGHPRTWFAIRDECLPNLDQFLDLLTDLNMKLARNWNDIIGKRREKLNDVNLSKFESFYSKESFNMERHDKVSIELMKETFADFQIIVWIIEGIGSIYCSAITDDKFGIVQQDLGRFLTILCQIEGQLEKFGRLCTTMYIEEKKRHLLMSNRLAVKNQLVHTLRQLNACYQENLKYANLAEEHLELIRKI